MKKRNSKNKEINNSKNSSQMRDIDKANLQMSLKDEADD